MPASRRRGTVRSRIAERDADECRPGGDRKVEQLGPLRDSPCDESDSERHGGLGRDDRQLLCDPRRGIDLLDADHAERSGLAHRARQTASRLRRHRRVQERNPNTEKLGQNGGDHSCSTVLETRFTRRCAALEVEEELLAPQPARVAPQRAVLADDAMAAHDDRQRVASDGLADPASQRPVSERVAQLAVRRGLPERDLVQERPDALFERVSVRIRGHIERRALSPQILPKLARRLRQHRVGRAVDLFPEARPVGIRGVVGKVDADEGAAGRDECELSQLLRRDDGVTCVHRFSLLLRRPVFPCNVRGPRNVRRSLTAHAHAAQLCRQAARRRAPSRGGALAS